MEIIRITFDLRRSTERITTLIDFDRYTEGEGAPTALVGALTASLADAEGLLVVENQNRGYAVRTDGKILDWARFLDRPVRRTGNVALTDPDSFVEYLQRYADNDTLLYASVENHRIVAVLNDHPETTGEGSLAGYRDNTAVLRLQPSEDWQEITAHSGRTLAQRAFAELIEELAHCVTNPPAAVMMEIASTLSVKQNLDFDSRLRLDSGDIQFRFEQTSDARAGRTVPVEIPQVIEFTVPIWTGTEPVRIQARLRFRASQDGAAMGYKLMQRADVTEKAFRDIVVAVNGRGVAPAALYGNAMIREF
jgi:uncharacterized protein YfdQ (DUF2303 family)